MAASASPTCGLPLTQAVAYAPRPTKAAWPNEVMPPTPVSSTSPTATIEYRPM